MAPIAGTLSRAPGGAAVRVRAPALACGHRLCAANPPPSQRRAAPEKSSAGGSSFKEEGVARAVAGTVAAGLTQQAIARNRRRGNTQVGATQTKERDMDYEMADRSMVTAAAIPTTTVDDGVSTRLRALAIVVLCFLVTVICALDRTAMSVAIIPMSEEYQYADSTKGVVQSAYFWGYTLSNLVSGVAATQVSPKLVLTLGVVFWSAFTVLTPTAAGISVTALLACRALMGVAEGACLPTIQQFLANWVSREERGKALALVTSGITAGTVGALYLSPTLVSVWGWPSVFVLFGSAGFLWCSAWAPTAADAPEGNEECIPYACELNWDTAEGVAQSWGNVQWGEMARSSAFRGVVLCGMAHNTGAMLLQSWLPTYFAQTFHLGVQEASMLSVPPWIASFLVGNAAGWVADALVARGVALLDVRRGFQLIGSLGPCACMLLLASAPHSQQEAEILFTAALGMASCSYLGFNAAPQDMAQRTTSAVYGFLNAAGCLTASMAIWATGVVLDATPDQNSGFSMVFYAAAAAYAIGAAAFVSFYRGEKEFS